jgi:hypothetical protein
MLIRDFIHYRTLLAAGDATRVVYLIALAILVVRMTRRQDQRERATTPGTPSALTAQLSVARWRDDPDGVHHYRYWDGHTWTEYVADDGIVSQDPTTARPIARNWVKRGERWYCLRHGLTDCEQCPDQPT